MRHLDKVTGRCLEKTEQRTLTGKAESRLDIHGGSSYPDQEEKEEYGQESAITRSERLDIVASRSLHREELIPDIFLMEPEDKTQQNVSKESVEAEWKRDRGYFKRKIKGARADREPLGGVQSLHNENAFSFSGQEPLKEGKEGSQRQERKNPKSKPTNKISYVEKYTKLSRFKHIADHEVKSQYDPEERKRSAVIETIVGKAKGQMQSAGLQVGKAFGKAAIKLLQKASLAFAAILPFLLIFLSLMGLVGVIISVFIIEKEESQNQGYFGKMYYWIEYETGKKDDSAFATVLGDGGKAFGIQFDYRYALQPFMRDCVARNPIAYSAFTPYLFVDKSVLLGNRQLAAAWTSVFEGNKENFIEDQKNFAKVNYYDGIERSAEQFGIPLKERDEVCKGAVLSYSFQNGSSGALAAVKELKEVGDDKAFLKRIYEIRTREFPAYADRYKREYQTALELLEGRAFTVPVDMAKCTVTSEFGEDRGSSIHKGTDFGSYGGEKVPVMAIGDGKVLIAGYSTTAGNWVVMDHGNGIVAKYMHLDSLAVRVGEEMKKGEEMGKMGNTGLSFGVHLHLQIELNGIPVNPRDYISF